MSTNADGSRLMANLAKGELPLQAGYSNFGEETQLLITNIEAPLLILLNQAIIPGLNKVLNVGVPLPSFNGTINQYVNK